MFYKVEVTAPADYTSIEHKACALVEADNIRTARNVAIDHFIKVEKATDLELVEAGRDGWLIISDVSEMATDDGQPPLELPTPHAQTADTAEPRPLSTGSAPPWLPPVNAPATDTGD